jgi:hypothetical protein
LQPSTCEEVLQQLRTHVKPVPDADPENRVNVIQSAGTLSALVDALRELESLPHGAGK